MRILLFSGLSLIIPLRSISQDTLCLPDNIGVIVSLPWLNNYFFYSYELNQSITVTGFTGVGISGFSKTDKRKFTLNSGFTDDLPVPIGPFDYAKEGTRTNISSTFFEGVYHRSISPRVNLIYRVNYIRYRFDFICYIDSLPSFSVADKSLELTTGAEYRFEKNTSFALFYQPAVFSFDKRITGI